MFKLLCVTHQSFSGHGPKTHSKKKLLKHLEHLSHYKKSENLDSQKGEIRFVLNESWEYQTRSLKTLGHPKNKTVRNGKIESKHHNASAVDLTH